MFIYYQGWSFMFAKYLGMYFKKGGTERIMYLDYVSRINTKQLLII